MPTWTPIPVAHRSGRRSGRPTTSLLGIYDTQLSLACPPPLATLRSLVAPAPPASFRSPSRSRSPACFPGLCAPSSQAFGRARRAGKRGLWVTFVWLPCWETSVGLLGSGVSNLWTKGPFCMSHLFIYGTALLGAAREQQGEREGKKIQKKEKKKIAGDEADLSFARRPRRRRNLNLFCSAGQDSLSSPTPSTRAAKVRP